MGSLREDSKTSEAADPDPVGSDATRHARHRSPRWSGIRPRSLSARPRRLEGPGLSAAPREPSGFGAPSTRICVGGHNRAFGSTNRDDTHFTLYHSIGRAARLPSPRRFIVFRLSGQIPSTTCRSAQTAPARGPRSGRAAARWGLRTASRRRFRRRRPSCGG